MKRNKIRWIIFSGIIIICIIIIYLYNTQYIPKENISEIKINLNQFLDMTSFKEKENIEKALKIEETLTEKSLPFEFFGNYQTIEYNIIYENGKLIKRKYENVYPVHKIFEELVENDNHINNVGVEFDKDLTILSNYILNINSEKVLKTLKEIGVYEELLILPEDIEFFTISKGNEKIIVKDKKITQIILDLAQPYSNGETVITCEATTKDGYIVYGTFFNNNIPEDIKKLF